MRRAPSRHCFTSNQLSFSLLPWQCWSCYSGLNLNVLIPEATGHTSRILVSMSHFTEWFIPQLQNSLLAVQTVPVSSALYPGAVPIGNLWHGQNPEPGYWKTLRARRVRALRVPMWPYVTLGILINSEWHCSLAGYTSLL